MYLAKRPNQILFSILNIQCAINTDMGAEQNAEAPKKKIFLKANA